MDVSNKMRPLSKLLHKKLWKQTQTATSWKAWPNGASWLEIPSEDFFNNLGNFQSPQEPQTPQLNPEGSYGGGGYSKNNNRGGQDPRQARPQKAKGLLEEFGISVSHENCPQRGWPALSHWPWQELSYKWNSQPSNQEQSGSDWRTWGQGKNCRCGRPGSKNRRWWRSS